MSYERVTKDALYFSKEEIELLRSCVGKEVVATYSVGAEDMFGIAHLALEFADGSFITVGNEYADMPYFPGEGDEQYLEEGGNFRLLPGKLQAVESYWSRYQLTHDDLPVCPIVRRAYVINQSLAYNNAGPDNTVHSFTHTSGIILAFWDDDQDKPYGQTTYMIIQQERRNTEFISLEISFDTNRFISASMREWDKPDLYSTSLIRVG